MPTTEEEKRIDADFDDLPPELVVKHPLENTWTLWFYKNDRNKDWTENQMEIAEFGTVEDFWALYNHLELPSRLPPGSDYAVFKQGVKPMWEDKRNKEGGRWLLHVDIRDRNVCLDIYWLNILLCMIGEDFEDCNDDICGAVVQVRPRSDRVALWTADVSHRDIIMKIERIIIDRLKVHPKMLKYEVHEDTQSKNNSTSKTK